MGPPVSTKVPKSAQGQKVPSSLMDDKKELVLRNEYKTEFNFLIFLKKLPKSKLIPLFKELTEAFKGMDPTGKGYIKSKDLWHILVKWGEKLSPREGMVILWFKSLKVVTISSH